MSTQTEAMLESDLIAQLVGLGYAPVQISNETELLANLKKQLEAHNQIELSAQEFKQITDALGKGNIFDKAKILRQKIDITRDDDTIVYIELLNQDLWCQNLFQVASQITMVGKYENRYDVTLLINGLPLVQIELKRRGLELKEAFNQTNCYQKHSYGAGEALFRYVQLFVISNGVNTKYYANNNKLNFKQTFYWSDEQNRLITRLEDFTKVFLEPCHIAKMITKYIVLNTKQTLMVLRPYQYYAVEAILERVKNTTKNAYIWHTTGSGKTLTSFKASQLLIALPTVHKVVFVVDRKDLDSQTTKEFNDFAAGSVDGSDDTTNLVKQLIGTYKDKKGEEKETKLIITTIQKLNTALQKKHHLAKIEPLKDKRIIFIFDECHRSQFGDTHKRIKAFFQASQMIGFTGTPIFAENAVRNSLGKRTTKELFETCLHKYVITDAIKDENVLKFSVEYVGKYRRKSDSQNEIDIAVEDIDTQEILDSPQRIGKIVEYVLEHHNRKTHNKDFTAMFCVSSIEVLITYYELFKAQKQAGKHNLKVATIFSYGANENEREPLASMDFEEFNLVAEPASEYGYAHTREKLDEYIADFNAMFGTKHSTKDSQAFYNYYNDVSKHVKDKKVDILLVVNMFLTGFDSPCLNTLYVDKNLQYHGLIQAFSRTNRILNEKKSQGNIVCFRNLKHATDEAITLFSNKEAIDVIVMQPYENYVARFQEAFARLTALVPTADSVHALPTEEEELDFVQKFRELIRLKNILGSFADFSFEDLGIEEQTFEDYKTQYLDIHDKAKRNTEKEKVSVLHEIDFELELIQRDEINVAYILRLLRNLQESNATEREARKKAIIDMLAGEVNLRSKRELIERFIEENLPYIEDLDTLENVFEEFWNTEQTKAFERFCIEENLNPESFHHLISEYIFTNRLPTNDMVIKALLSPPSILQKATIAKRLINKVQEFVEVYMSGV